MVDVNMADKFGTDPIATVLDADGVPVTKDPGGTPAGDGVALWSTVRSYLEGALSLAASRITSGTFADARVAESNVTQHEAAINHDNLTGFVANEHIDWTADQGATNIDAGNVTGLTHGDQVDNPSSGVHGVTGSVVGTTDTQTLTSKTIDANSNTLQNLPAEIGIAASDETTDLTTGTAKATFRVPHAMTVTEVRASVTTAPAGSTITVDINEGGTSILSTKLTIDAGETTSTTAATAAVISDSALADDAEITIDIDQVGSSTAGAGLKVWLIGTRA